MDFDAFYRDTSRRLARYAYGLAGDPVETQDLVQEASARCACAGPGPPARRRCHPRRHRRDSTGSAATRSGRAAVDPVVRAIGMATAADEAKYNRSGPAPTFSDGRVVLLTGDAAEVRDVATGDLRRLVLVAAQSGGKAVVCVLTQNRPAPPASPPITKVTAIDVRKRQTLWQRGSTYRAGEISSAGGATLISSETDGAPEIFDAALASFASTRPPG